MQDRHSWPSKIAQANLILDKAPANAVVVNAECTPTPGYGTSLDWLLDEFISANVPRPGAQEAETSAPNGECFAKPRIVK